MDKTVTLKLPDGHQCSITGALQDRSIVGAIEANAGLYEPHVMKVVGQVIQSDFICMDIGANIGVLSMPMARAASQGKVFSIECSSRNYAYLERNIAANGIDNCSPIHCGVSDRRQVVKFNYVEEVAGCSFISPLGVEVGLSEEVQLDTIDQILLEHGIQDVHFIKLDVEGGEHRALLGAQSLLAARLAPLLLIEFNPTPIQRFYGEDPATLYGLLRSVYRFIFLISYPSGDLVRIKSFDELMGVVSKGKGWEDLLCANSDVSTQLRAD